MKENIKNINELVKHDWKIVEIKLVALNHLQIKLYKESSGYQDFYFALGEDNK